MLTAPWNRTYTLRRFDFNFCYDGRLKQDIWWWDGIALKHESSSIIWCPSSRSGTRSCVKVVFTFKNKQTHIICDKNYITWQKPSLESIQMWWMINELSYNQPPGGDGGHFRGALMASISIYCKSMVWRWLETFGVVCTSLQNIHKNNSFTFWLRNVTYY